MFNRNLVAATLTAFFLQSWFSSSLSANTATTEFSTLLPESVSIDEAAHAAKENKCTMPSCMAVIRLNRLFDIIEQGEDSTMGAAHYFSRDQPTVEEKRLHAILLDHPNRLGPMCALLTSLASRYGIPGGEQGKDFELFVGVEAIDMALRMDGHGPPHCLPAVLAAMPRTQEADTAIANARDLCEGEPVARNPCARIVRPAKP